MRIEVSQVQQQLAEENTNLEKALVDTEALIIELTNFVFENRLSGSAYLSIKIFYSSVMLPLAKAMAHMYQAKLNANHRYSSSLRSFLVQLTQIIHASA